MKPFELPKKDLKTWIHDLRSGKFEQGSGKLYNSEEGTFCCLGVHGYRKGVALKDLDKKELLCDLVMENTKDIHNSLVRKSSNKDLGMLLSILNDGINVSGLLSMKESEPRIDFGIQSLEELKTLYTFKFSFDEIADFLERNVEPI